MIIIAYSYAKKQFIDEYLSFIFITYFMYL